jgi:hypothetical protein
MFNWHSIKIQFQQPLLSLFAFEYNSVICLEVQRRHALVTSACQLHHLSGKQFWGKNSSDLEKDRIKEFNFVFILFLSSQGILL